MSNCHKAVNYIIAISKAQYENIIEIANLSYENFKNVWAGKLKIFW